MKLVKEQDYYQVVHDNGVIGGDVYMEVDGYYVFCPVLRGGFWSQDVLLWIGHELEKLNKDWDDTVNKYFKENDAQIQGGDTQD